jgi:hypothetical protein
MPVWMFFGNVFHWMGIVYKNITNAIGTAYHQIGCIRLKRHLPAVGG